MADVEPSRWQRLQSLFDQALPLDRHGREAVCAAAEIEDESLARELRTLLRHEDDSQFLAQPAIDRPIIPPPGAERLIAGDRVADFTVVRVLGRGGAATVYEAIQDAPRRTVALKLLRGEFVHDAASLRRFRSEAAALARLRHPEIAQVHAFGFAAERIPQPYLAVEFVPGALPLTAFAESRQLPLRERVSLLVRVCDALAHGHARGILHRDLKPANILVGSDGGLRVIDFGIARVLDLEGEINHAEAGDATQVGTLLGTPAYMSPEQFDGDPLAIDVRSDVYSLGVVLFETLLARLPIDVAKLRPSEAARHVREDRPTRPTALARERGLRFDRDLETIILTALAKDRDDRYESVAAMRDDLIAWLGRRPISASPPSAIRRCVLAAKRHPLPLAVIAAATMAVSVAVGHALRAGAIAEREARQAVETKRQLARMLDSDAAERNGKQALLADLLVDVSATLPGEGLAPVTEAEVRHLIGRGFDRLGMLDEAAKEFERARELIEAAAPESSLHATILTDLMGPAYDARRLDEGLALGERALAIHTRETGRETAEAARTLNELAILATERKDFTTAIAASHEAYELFERLLGAESIEATNAIFNLGVAMHKADVQSLGLQLKRVAIERSRAASLGGQRIGGKLRLLGAALACGGDLLSGLDVVEEAEAILVSAYGERHPMVASCSRSRSMILFELNRYDDARRAAERVVKITEDLFDPSDPASAEAHAFHDDMRLRIESLANGRLHVGEERRAEGR